MIVRLRKLAAGATTSPAATDTARTGRKSGTAPTTASENGNAAMARKIAGSVPPTGAKSKAAPAKHARTPSAKTTMPTAPVPAPGGSDSKGAPGGGRTKKPRQSLWFRPGAVNVKLIYAGYLASLAMPPVALIAGFFAFQSAKQDPPHWLATHYLYQTRTFWMGFAANLIAYALSFAGVGLLLFPLIAVWLVARSVKGLIRVAQGVEIEEPLSFFV